MAKYKKVESDLKVSTFTEVSKDEVEDEIIAAMKEGQEKIAQLEAENRELRERVKKAEGPRPLPLVSKKSRRFINELRRQDTRKTNKTCAACTKRCSIPKEMNEHEDFCNKCLGR